MTFYWLHVISAGSRLGGKGRPWPDCAPLAKGPIGTTSLAAQIFKQVQESRVVLRSSAPQQTLDVNLQSTGSFRIRMSAALVAEKQSLEVGSEPLVMLK